MASQRHAPHSKEVKTLITVVMLTKNEAHHIERALASTRLFADRVFIADSGSTDATVERAEALGATVKFNPWVNYATQYNWALNQLPDDTEWVLRLDADEYITEALGQEIKAKIGALDPEISGVFVQRRMTFLRRPIKWGGIFPVQMLRLFRYGKGRCENRWMDEHILVDGPTVVFDGELIDDNMNSLTWWTEKHNAYACREAVDLLNLKYGFLAQETVADLKGGQQAGVKRWIKENIYARLPIGIRAFAYFFYRYIIRFGFLDGKEGTAFHFLQGFWYRYLVDIKIFEVERSMKRDNLSPEAAIRQVLGINI